MTELDYQDYDHATWNQDMEDINSWIDAGCPVGGQRRIQAALNRQLYWLRKLWRGENADQAKG